LVESPEVGSKERRERFPQSPPTFLPQVAVEAPVSMSHVGEPTMKEDEKVFRKAFFDMKKMVKVLYEERNTRLQGERSKLSKGEGSSRGGNGNGGKPPPYTPSSSSSSSQESSPSSTNTPLTHTHQNTSKGTAKSPLIKLDVKFDMPMYNGEVNVEKLDNWICQLEVHCRIQNLQEDDTQIQLASSRMEVATLVWWESKTQEEIRKTW